MYTEEQAKVETLKYFNGDELAADVFLKKYALRNDKDELMEKTPDDMHWRLANEFARIEAKKFKLPLGKNRIYNFLKNFKYIVPQGSPMFGIGNNYQIVSLSNCYVLETPEDSYNSILDIDKQLVNISKRRGGVGIDLSKLRPEGFPTKNAAKSSTGVPSFAERYSNSIREVGQKNRRGALMLTLSIHHPDILKFITMKNDPTKVTGANISVKLSSEFFEALENDTDYELRFPVDSPNPTFKQMISAKEVWKILIHAAWLRAEPGLLMWDNILCGPADCYAMYRSVSTNPSLRKGTLILTKNGPKEIQDLEGIDFEVYNLNHGYSKALCRLSGNNQSLYEVKLSTGFSYYATKEHKWATNNGEKTTLELNIGDKLPIQKRNVVFNGSLGDKDDGFLIGWLLGDGWITKRSDTQKNQYGFIVSEEDMNNGIGDKILEILKSKLNFTGNWIKRIRDTSIWYEINTVSNSFDDYFLRFDNPSKNTGITKRIICNASEEFIRGLLDGYLSSDGSIDNKNNKITFVSKNEKLLSDISEILGFYGIRTSIRYSNTNSAKFPNNKNYDKTYHRYDLVICDTKSIEHFSKLFNISHINKQNKLLNLKSVEYYGPNCDYVSVKSVKSTDLKEDVWDITVFDKNNCFSLSHCITHNCSEIPLACLDSCRLLVLMLLSFVKNPFTKDAYFDYNSFYEAAQIAQRLMDDLVDLESEKIDKIIDKIKSDPESDEIKRAEIELWQKIKKINDEGRRTGLGVTAVGDTLAALGIKYGSDESIKIVDEIYKTLKFGAYRASVDMAKELGPFVGWNPELEKDCDFLNRFRVESILAQDSIDGQPDVYGIDIFKDMQKYGRRNVALLTTAPTGSLSLLTQTTSGIEPLFRIEPYIRRRKLMNAEEKADFVDQNGDRWQEYPVYHPTIQMWMDITKETDLTKSPWYGATANDIDWINRVRLQAAAQKHICHAISSTINLPNNVTEETVSQIYLEAYKSGCKGMTIYRDGCRSGVLIEKKNDLAVHHAPDRPKELPCDVHHVTVKGKKYFVIIGLFGDSKQPYEVFAGRGDLISNEVKKGKIIKVRTSFYKAVLEDDTILSPITLGCNEEEEAITRLTSMALRHGAPVQFVLEQLAKIDTDISSFIKAVSRALKKYVPDETKSSEKCKECEGELVYSDGCVKCSSCGWSKC